MRNGDEFTKNREGYRYAFAYLRANPAHLITMLPTKLFWLYHTDSSGFYGGAFYAPMEDPSPLAGWIAGHERVLEALTFRYYEGLMVLGVIGALLTLVRGRRTWIWLILSVPLLLTFFHQFFHAKDRFHIPGRDHCASGSSDDCGGGAAGRTRSRRTSARGESRSADSVRRNCTDPGSENARPASVEELKCSATLD